MDRGDIWHVDLDPITGREQAGSRYVLIISKREFNKLGAPLCVPITQGGNFAREKGFAVTLLGAGTRTSGVVLCNQLRVLDLLARNAKRVEQVPDHIVSEVLAKVAAIIE